jgi:hypothetical protein
LPNWQIGILANWQTLLDLGSLDLELTGSAGLYVLFFKSAIIPKIVKIKFLEKYNG